MIQNSSNFASGTDEIENYVEVGDDEVGVRYAVTERSLLAQQGEKD